MRITMVTVQSLDGKLTHGDDAHVYSWNSDEDAKHWKKFRDEASLIVMGRKTYEAMAATMQHQSGKLRVVVTTHPEAYQNQVIPGMLEFTGEQPAELVERLTSAGHKAMLLAGGGTLNGAFLRAGQVTEIYTTIEPRLFGQGASLAGSELIDIPLKLDTITQLNEHGTILLHYTIA